MTMSRVEEVYADFDAFPYAYSIWAKRMWLQRQTCIDGYARNVVENLGTAPRFWELRLSRNASAELVPVEDMFPAVTGMVNEIAGVLQRLGEHETAQRV